MPLLAQIVETLEEHGVMRDEVVLHEFIDFEALHRIVATGSDVTITFAAKDVLLRVTPSGVTAVDSAREV